MLVEFANEERKLVKRYKFYPYTALATELATETIEELLLNIGIKGFSVEQKVGLTYISAVSFSELRRIGNALSIYASKKPLIIEPERSFLLQRNWSYFDSFSLLGSELFKIDSFSGAAQVSDDIGFFVIKGIPFREALKINEDKALFMMRQKALSSLLAVPSDKVPLSVQERTETLLENIFFRNGSMLSWNEKDSFTQSTDFAPSCFVESASTIDFSLVWAQLITNSFYNLGTETLNCSCCKPIQLKDKNILPSSLIEVSFTDDNVFFESSSQSFALSFHKNNVGSEMRTQKKKEFFFTSYPVGPFSKGQLALVPIADANKLLDEGKAVLGKEHKPDWFCNNKESFLSKEVRNLTSRNFALDGFVSAFDKTESLFESKGAAYHFAAFQLEGLNELTSELPLHLTNQQSKFFSPHLAGAILALQESTLSKFKEFSENKGYRVLHSNKKSVFIKGYSSLALAKSFAKEEALPQPVVKAFSKQTRLCETA